MTSNSKTLFQKSKYNVYDRIDNSLPIEFMNKDSEMVMRYTFSEPSKIIGLDDLVDKNFSFYNKNNNTKVIDKVFHFDKIENMFVDVVGEKHDINTKSGFMTATFCHIVLELLNDYRLSKINFEINLVNNGKVRINGQLTSWPKLYDKLLSDKDKDDNKNVFKGFLVEKRQEDITFYSSVLDKTSIDIEKDMLLSQFNYGNCSEAELKIEFEERLHQAKQASVKKPFCIPNGHEKVKKEFVLNDEIVLENGFSFYHHCENDIVKFALENRENGKLHIESMSELYLDEYPAPNFSGRIFMVSTNGQHRRLVFVCLGLKTIEARIQFVDRKNRNWRYYFHKKNLPMEMVIEWLISKGRIEKIERLDRSTFLIEDNTQLIPWILPNSEISSFSEIRKDMLDRLRFVEKSFGPQDFKYGFIRKSGVLWYLDVQRVHLINIFRNFCSKV